MIKLAFVVALALGACTAPVVAQTAQPKIFVASTGSDSNDGGRAAPKRSFQAAHDAVAAGGEIVALDTAGYGSVAITKSVGIVVPPGVNGFVTATGDGITINAAATDTVTLRGLIIEGSGSSGSTRGVNVTSVGLLVLEDTTIRDFYEGLHTDLSVASKIVVRRGAVRGNKFGIDVETHASVKIDALVTDTELSGNGTAFYTAGLGTGSTVHLVAARCAVSGTTNNVFYTYGPTSYAVADGCTITGNGNVFLGVQNGTNYVRNNAIASYANYGTTSAFTGQLQ